ncbi:3-deoxy-7-phosphoheptulonate synthase [Endothiovibrio diazotrophicus]
MAEIFEMSPGAAGLTRHVVSMDTLEPPTDLKQRVGISPAGERFVAKARAVIRDILFGNDPRLLVVVGPCSVHDPLAALDYAKRLKRVAEELADQLFIVMRVYFEKPRTSIGWKGLINDPRLDGSFRMAEGLALARHLLLGLAELKMPAATESLDPIAPQYLHDLVSWTAIGARTTESQTHREMASGLSSPVGFKNGTDGGIDVAVHAMLSAAQPHSFLGIDQEGRVSLVQTRGNRDAHLVLRGGGGRPNYTAEYVARAEKALRNLGMQPRIMIDCSHVNSRRDPKHQPMVADAVVAQILAGNTSIKGIMLESNIREGSQPLVEPPTKLRYGVSITDACLGWEETHRCLHSIAEKLKDAQLQQRASA